MCHACGLRKHWRSGTEAHIITSVVFPSRKRMVHLDIENNIFLFHVSLNIAAYYYPFSGALIQLIFKIGQYHLFQINDSSFDTSFHTAFM